MNSVEIKGNLRTQVGKPGAKQLRREDKVPCVLYGTEAPVHFSTHINSFKQLIYTPDAYLVKLEVEGKNYEAVLQDAQYHPVTDTLIHADFLLISQDKPVVIDIPVVTTGNSVGVLAGGRLVINLRTVKVKALPGLLPDTIQVDITNIALGETVKVKDLQLPEGVEAINVANSVVVAVKTTRVSRSESAGAEVAGAEEEAAEEAAEA